MEGFLSLLLFLQDNSFNFVKKCVVPELLLLTAKIIPFILLIYFIHFMLYAFVLTVHFDS